MEIDNIIIIIYTKYLLKYLYLQCRTKLHRKGRVFYTDKQYKDIQKKQ